MKASISALLLTGIAYVFAVPVAVSEELIFWNTLDSQVTVQNSKIGLNGTYIGGTFVPGQFGNAYRADQFTERSVTFPFGVIPTGKGTIEFWARLDGFPPCFGSGGSADPGLFEIADPGNAVYRLEFNENDGAGGGGLSANVGASIEEAATGSFGSYCYEDLLGVGEAEDWHHYAVIWDANGLDGIADGTKRVAVYLDGALDTTRWSTNIPVDGEFPPLEGGELQLVFSADWQAGQAVEIDNIKIWDEPRSDYSDRFDEDAGNRIGAETVGVTTIFAVCQNRTSGQTVVVLTGGADSFNCLEAGLQVNPGDNLFVIYRGVGN